jgi:Kef-type K+ transport system membrane component KefB
MRARDADQGTRATAHRPPRQVRFWSAAGYSIMVLGTIGAFLLIRGYGERLVAPPAAPVASFAEVTAPPAQVLVPVLVALAAVIITGQLLAALTAEVIGIHAIFGAFLLGAVIPHESVVARTLTRQLEHLVTILLLPAFFAFTGMRTRIDLVSGLDQWMLCALIILMATLGKFGGTLLAARLTGLSWRTAAALGTLMNTRGLMELIVLNVGLDLRVIAPPLFAMMVVMALVTTMATAPVLHWLLPPTAAPPASARAGAADGRPAESHSTGHQN